jgi:hypothetical protein
MRAFITIAEKPLLRRHEGQWSCVGVKRGKWPWSSPRIVTSYSWCPRLAYEQWQSEVAWFLNIPRLIL